MLWKMLFDSFWFFFLLRHAPFPLKQENFIYFQVPTFSSILSVPLSLNITNKLINLMSTNYFLEPEWLIVIKSCINIHCIEYCHVSRLSKQTSLRIISMQNWPRQQRPLVQGWKLFHKNLGLWHWHPHYYSLWIWFSQLHF